ncbi:MAG TPA: GDSL-type esterase/lipase family protein [Bryobacteraceae bacterium]|nr:GDSL-type esterase/lipase family protein [Bryobacteraceae bacterium]
MLPKKTSLAIATFGVFFLAVQQTKFARPYTPTSVVDFHPRQVHVAVDPPVSRPRPRTKHVTTPSLTEPNLIDPHDLLKPFYQALWRTEARQPGAVTRILHYGDSPTTADSITADVRSLLQERYGDAGHGFVLIAKPWAWYGHRGVDVSGRSWIIEPASQVRAKDGFHGLGGVNFQGGTGASSHLVLREDHSHMEVQYLQQPGGGHLSVRASGQVIAELETDGEKLPAFLEIAIPAGARTIDLTVDRGPVRLFGVSFEREGPGVIYNSLGLNGGQVQSVLRNFEKGQWALQLQHQRPDLVVVNYGTNESLYADYIERYYPGELREVIHRIKSAVANASVLIMSPMDRGQRDSTGQIVTPAALPRLVEIQRRIAAETNCAFFNTFQAMGGEGTMGRWYDSQPRLVSADFMHPLPAGAKKVGVLLFDALEAGYQEYKSKQEQRLAQREPGVGEAAQ